MATSTSAEIARNPDLSALSGKIKLVLSSFPQWDLKKSEARGERSASDFEPPEASFILGPEAQCQPILIVPQHDLEESSSSGTPDSSDEERPVVIPVPEATKTCGAPSEAKRLNESKETINLLSTPSETQSSMKQPPKQSSDSLEKSLPEIDPSRPQPTVPMLHTAASEQALGRMMIVTSNPLLREPSSKVPIMVTKSEDVSQLRQTHAEEFSKKAVPDHRSRGACSGCQCW